MATAITIKGIRIDSLSIKTDEKDGGANAAIESSYSLLSSNDKVLATQAVGGYQGMKVQPAADTIKKLNDFLVSYKRDVNNVLGLETE